MEILTKKEKSKIITSNFLYRKLRLLVDIFDPNPKEATIRVLESGGSYTDGKNITVSALAFPTTKSELLTWFTGVTVHEIEHNISSDFVLFTNFINEIQDYYEKEINLPKSYGKKVAISLLNGLEDGRIEYIAGLRTPKFAEVLRLNNLLIWENQETKNGDEFGDFLHAIVSLAVVKALPKKYEEIYPENAKLLLACKPIIEEATYSPTPQGAADAAKQLALVIKDKLKEFVEEAQDIESLMNQLKDELDFTGGNGTPFENDSNKNENEDNENNQEEQKEQEEQEDSQQGGNSDKESKEEGQKTSNNSKTEEQSDEQDDNSKQKSKSFETTDEDGFPKDEDIMKELDTLKKKTRQELEEEIKKLDNEMKNEGKPHDKKPTEREHIENFYEVPFTEHKKEDFIFTKSSKPSYIQKENHKYKKEIERIVRSRKNHAMFGLDSGQLDSKRLHLVPIGNYNVFKRNEQKSIETSVYFLIDASGSMGTKDFNQALNIGMALEEIFGEFVKLKIALFTTESNSVTHYIAKDWKDKNNKKINNVYNVSLNHIEQRGNIDGYSIRIATEELKKEMADIKLLFILSDGTPCYSFYSKLKNKNITGEEDVKEAVTEAQKENIEVMPIIFGSNEFRKNNALKYIQMYGKAINKEKGEILPEMVKVLKKNLK